MFVFREVVDGDEFLSLSSEQMIELISSDKLSIPSEEKIGELKLIIFIFINGKLKIKLPTTHIHVV